MTKELGLIKGFLTQYLSWVEQGAPLPDTTDAFTRGQGLCGNLANFLRSTMPYNPQDGTSIQEVHGARKSVRSKLAARLLWMFNDEDYPFGGEGEYIADCREQSHHERPERIQFCRDWLNELNLSEVKKHD